MQEPKAGRRIVSKGKYLQIQAARLFWWVDSLLLSLAALSCLLLAVGFGCGILRFAPWPLLRDLAITEHVWLLMLLPPLMYGFFGVGKECLARSRKRDVVPLTRANTADLPAPDSLVRASQEPTQAQEGVLLRGASGEAQAGQEGQLLRASVAGQE